MARADAAETRHGPAAAYVEDFLRENGSTQPRELVEAIKAEALAEASLVPAPDLAAVMADIDREPTLDEIKQYGLDGSPGSVFNTLQWKLDRLRAAASPTAHPAPREEDRP
jgi:hypothetical protein